MTCGRIKIRMVALDFQNLGVSATGVQVMDARIRQEVEQKAPAASRSHFKAFCHPSQRDAVTALAGLGWRNQSAPSDLDAAIVQQCRSYCGQDPQHAALFICSKDGDFASLVEDMRGRGVRVYVMGPHDSSRALIRAAGNGRIQLPYFG